MAQIKFLPENNIVEVEEGISLLQAAAQAGIFIKSGCGGKGSCGACKVRILKGEADIQGTGSLSAEQIEDKLCLSCRTYVQGDLTVEIPPDSRLAEHQVLMSDVQKGFLKEREFDLEQKYPRRPLAFKLRLKLSEPNLTDNAGDWSRLSLELADSLPDKGKHLHIPFAILQELPETLRQARWDLSITINEDEGNYVITKIEEGNDIPPLGLAVDIGTTTVVVNLINLETGELLDQQGSYNKQAQFGDDVISRIVYATDEPENRADIQKAVLSTLNELIDKLLDRQKLQKDHLLTAVVSANTTMIHLFLGIDPRYIRLEPYIPAVNDVPPIPAEKLGLNILGHGLVYCYPSVASYVGGDIVSGALVTDMANHDELVLFIDIGTNGEIVLGNNDWMVTCACSAGPCFEGGGITFGMRAMPGAIERIKIDPDTLDVEVKTVGRHLPIGICGSGLVDALARLREAGIIDRAGNFQLEHPSQSNRLRRTSDDKEFVLVWADQTGGKKDIIISENDVKNLIRAKGAIFAGIRSLLSTVDLDVAMLDRIVIAGGFGNYLNVPDAVQIGLLPDLPAEKFEFIGNSSVKGARLALLSRNAWAAGNELAHKMTYIELSVGTTFMDEFVSALFLPHTDLSLFPSVSI